MIRDPSDGSVREATKPDTSGLREPSHKPEYLERLDRSRQWLAKYRTNPERIARLMGETGE